MKKGDVMTKRYAAILIIGLALVTTITSAHANGYQEEHGLLVAPSPGRVAGIYIEGCPGVSGATLGWIAGTTLHPSFAVRSSTWGLPFVVAPAAATANVDITFMRAGSAVLYSTNKLGGEQGIVPAGATRAYVCLSYGPPTPFTYRAGA
jgi:hypothetical protein